MIRLLLSGLIFTFFLIGIITVSEAGVTTESTINRSSINIVATDFITADFSKSNHWLPMEITFKLDGAKALTIVDKILYIPPEALVLSQGHIELGALTKTYTSSQTLQSGRKVNFQTRFAKDSPSFSLYTDATDPPDGMVELVFRGIDRIVHQDGKKFAVIILGEITEAIRVKTDLLILQNHHTQEGLCLILPPNASETGIMVIPRSNSIGLRISCPRKTDKKGIKRMMSIQAVQGDALLALDNAKRFIAGEKERTQQPPSRASLKPATDSQIVVKKREYFPDRGRAFKPLLADPREALFHIACLADRHENIDLDLRFGGDLGLFWQRLAEDDELTLTARGLVTSRFDSLSSSFDLLNIDYIGGLALGLIKNRMSFEAFIYHQSSHLGDEKLESAERQRIDYSRETIRVLGDYRFGPLRLYGGPSYTFHAQPEQLENVLFLKLGADYKFIFLNQNMFLSCEFNSRQQNNWAIDSTAILGLELGDILLTKNRQYLFSQIFSGYSPMGQYYNVKEHYLMFGVGYNFQ